MKRFYGTVLFLLIAHIAHPASSKENLLQALTRSVVALGTKDSLGNWHPLGTGFLMFGYETAPNLLITNKHVLQAEARPGQKQLPRNIIVKANILQSTGLNFGKWMEFSLSLLSGDTVLWTGHPDADVDIAVCYFPPMDSSHLIMATFSDISYIPQSLCGSFDSLDLAEETIFLGFPLGLGSDRNPRPLVRYGIVAFIEPSEKMFLLDAQVFGGSSGSPVFSIGTSIGDRAKDKKGSLIGIISGFEPSPIRTGSFQKVADSAKRDTIQIPVENSGLAVVFSTDLINQTISLHHRRMESRYKGIMDSLGIQK